MKFSNEMIEKAKTAKTAEELLEMAKAENIELNAEEAAQAFAKMNKNGELSDEELDNVAGGCADPYQSGDTPIFNVGQRIYYLIIEYDKYDAGFDKTYIYGTITQVYPKENGVYRYGAEFMWPAWNGIYNENELQPA